MVRRDANSRLTLRLPDMVLGPNGTWLQNRCGFLAGDPTWESNRRQKPATVRNGIARLRTGCQAPSC